MAESKNDKNPVARIDTIMRLQFPSTRETTATFIANGYFCKRSQQWISSQTENFTVYVFSVQ